MLFRIRIIVAAVFALTVSARAAIPPTYLVEALLRDESGYLHLGKQIVTDDPGVKQHAMMQLVGFDDKGNALPLYDPGHTAVHRMRKQNELVRGDRPKTPPPPPLAQSTHYLGIFIEDYEGRHLVSFRESDVATSVDPPAKVGDVQWVVQQRSIFRVQRIASAADPAAATLRESFVDYQKRTREIIAEFLEKQPVDPVKSSRQWRDMLYVLRNPALRLRAREALQTWLNSTDDTGAGGNFAMGLAYVATPDDLPLITKIADDPAKSFALRWAVPTLASRLGPKTFAPVALKLLEQPDKATDESYFAGRIREKRPDLPVRTIHDELAAQLVLAWKLDPRKFSLTRSEVLYAQVCEPTRIVGSEPTGEEDLLFATPAARKTGLAFLKVWLQKQTK